MQASVLAFSALRVQQRSGVRVSARRCFTCHVVGMYRIQAPAPPSLLLPAARNDALNLDYFPCFHPYSGLTGAWGGAVLQQTPWFESFKQSGRKQKTIESLQFCSKGVNAALPPRVVCGVDHPTPPGSRG